MTTLATTRHTAATREAILEAAADLFLEKRGQGFSIQEVGDRAGLTHRTVYRYFSTRQELMAATAQHLAPDVAGEPFLEVSTVEEWIDGVGAHFALIEANLEVVRSVIVAVLASEEFPLQARDALDRETRYWEVFRRQFPHLPDDDARRTFATLRQLRSSVSYLFLRLRFGLSLADATVAVQTGAMQIVEQAARRDRATADGRRTS
jgi:AcrR family transcriptional regulator